MRLCRIGGLVVLLAVASIAPALAGEANVDDLIREFSGQAEPVTRSPAQLQAAYARVLAALVAQMATDEMPRLQAPVDTLQGICWRAARPGADAERLAVCQAMAAELGKDIPGPARVWLTKQLEYIGRAEAVEALAAQMRNADPMVRERARRALQRNPAPQAGAALIAELGRAATPEWKAALVNALGYRNDKAAVPALIAQAASDDEAVRTAAVQALARIGDKAAAGAIAAAVGKGSAPAKAMATDAWLLLADKLAAQGEKADALAIYRKLLGSPGYLRCAAIVGIGRAGGTNELDTIFAALADPDAQVRGAGLQALGLLPAREVMQAIVEKMKAAPPQMKVVLLRALAQGGDKDALPAFATAASDLSEEVRIAAYEGMGLLANPQAAPTLVAVVARAKGNELAAAKAALGAIPGDAATAEILKATGTAAPAGQVELIGCLAARRAAGAGPALLKLAEAQDPAVRTEALKALTDLAEASDLAALVKLLVKAADDRERAAAERAVVAVAKRIDDEGKRAEPVLAALGGGGPVPTRISLLKVLSRLGGEKAMAAVQAALRDPDKAIQDTAIRELPSWATPAVADEMLRIARESKDLTQQVLALRGAVDVIGRLGSLPAEQVLALYKGAMAAAARPDDKKMVLAGMAGMGNLGALELAQTYLKDPGLKAEAELATVKIARAISGSHTAKAKDVLAEILTFSDNDQVKKEARDGIALIEKFDDYLTAWQVSGPYEQGEKDAAALFDIAFPPEKPGDTTAKWRTMPIGTDANRPWLIEFDKTDGIRGDNRCVYLRTRVFSPERQSAQMEAGSDDGIKVWIGGKLVHANNATRPNSPGSDKKIINLDQGWNDVLVKVTQGGGEWSACLRLRAPGGGRLEGIRADPAGK